MRHPRLRNIKETLMMAAITIVVAMLLQYCSGQ
jgi:hypothetical protein